MNIANVLEVGWVDVLVVAFLFYILYRVFLRKRTVYPPPPPTPLDPMKKRDFTTKDLLEYNGVDNERILMAICGQVLDVTAGKAHYGPEGPYGKLAGHDATRALATWDVEKVSADYDDHHDMSAAELADAQDWADRLSLRYPRVGRLIRDDEEPMDYNGEEACISTD